MNFIIVSLDTAFQSIGNFLDNKIFENKLVLRFGCVFFNFTSKITNFFLFNTFGFVFFLFGIGFCIQHYYSDFNAFILTLKLVGFKKTFSVFVLLPFGLQIFLISFILFYQVVVINTCLGYSKKIGVYMQAKYNDKDILIKLHYNHGLSTLAKSVVPAITAVCIFCGKDVAEAWKVQTAMEGWTKVSSEALQAGQEIPTCPVQINVITSSKTSTDIQAIFDKFSKN